MGRIACMLQAVTLKFLVPTLWFCSSMIIYSSSLVLSGLIEPNMHYSTYYFRVQEEKNNAEYKS